MSARKEASHLLTKRQEDILFLIIQTYTTTHSPVGSKFLMSAGIKASSATIRNEMSILEEKGLLQKTHSSSGRIPSFSGLRYYVDHLVSPSNIPHPEIQMIQNAFQQPFKEIDDIIETSAKILSQLTSYTAFSLGPELKERRLTGFRIVPLNDYQVIALIITDYGNVESQIFNIPPEIESSDLQKMVNIINERLIGEDLLSVYHKLRTEIPLILQRYFQSPLNMSQLFDELFNQTFMDHVFVGGKMNLLDFHFHKDMEQFRSVYSLIENRQAISELLEKQMLNENSIAVAIGDEIGNEALDDMSMITASYEVSGHGKGTIALLGPTVMPYSKIIGLMKVFSKELSQGLTDYYQRLDREE